MEDVAGLDVRADYEAMCAGGVPKALVPDPDAFGGRFAVAPTRIQINDSQHSNEKILRDEWVDGYIWSVRDPQ